MGDSRTPLCSTFNPCRTEPSMIKKCWKEFAWRKHGTEAALMMGVYQIEIPWWSMIAISVSAVLPESPVLASCSCKNKWGIYQTSSTADPLFITVKDDFSISSAQTWSMRESCHDDCRTCWFRADVFEKSLKHLEVGMPTNCKWVESSNTM